MEMPIRFQIPAVVFVILLGLLLLGPANCHEVRRRARVASSYGTFLIEVLGPKRTAQTGQISDFIVKTAFQDLPPGIDPFLVEPEYHAVLQCPEGIISQAVLKSTAREGDGSLLSKFQVSPGQRGNHTLYIYLQFADVSDTLTVSREVPDFIHAVAQRYSDGFTKTTEPTLVVPFFVNEGNFDYVEKRPCTGFLLSSWGFWKQVGTLRHGVFTASGKEAGTYLFTPTECLLPAYPPSQYLKDIPSNHAVLFLGDSTSRSAALLVLDLLLGLSPTRPSNHLTLYEHEFCKKSTVAPEKPCDFDMPEGVTFHVPLKDDAPQRRHMCRVLKNEPWCLKHRSMYGAYLSANIHVHNNEKFKPLMVHATFTWHFSSGKKKTAVFTYAYVTKSKHPIGAILANVTQALGRKYDRVVYSTALHDLSDTSLEGFERNLVLRGDELASYGAKVLVFTSSAQNAHAKRKWVHNNMRGYWVFGCPDKRSRAFNKKLVSTLASRIPDMHHMDLYDMTNPLKDEECYDGLHFHPGVNAWTTVMLMYNINVIDRSVLESSNCIA